MYKKLFKQWKGFVAGATVMAVITGGAVVFGEDISKTVDVVYKNIKIFVDGAEYVAKDGNGNVVEPFIYNGTTYLPVRGVANAFGKDVVWDGANASIFLGKKDQNQPDNWLDRIQYSYFGSGEQRNNFEKITGNIIDINKNVYTNGLLFGFYNTNKLDDGCNITIDYPVSMQYSKLTGKIVLPKKIDNITKSNDVNVSNDKYSVKIFADDREIYTSPVAVISIPLSFDISIKGANKITIKLYSNYGYNSYVALTDLALYK